MSAEYTINCDRCGSVIEASRVSANCARISAINAGAMFRFGKEDVCIHCAARDDTAAPGAQTTAATS